MNKSKNPSELAKHPVVASTIESLLRIIRKADLDGVEDNTIHLSTRDSGSVYNETPGADDIRRFKQLRDNLEVQFPNIHGDVTTCDEWTSLDIQVFPEPLPPRPPSRDALLAMLPKVIAGLGPRSSAAGWPIEGSSVEGAFSFSLCHPNKAKWNWSVGVEVFVKHTSDDNPRAHEIVVLFGSLVTTAKNLNDVLPSIERLWDASGPDLRFAGIRFFLGDSMGFANRTVNRHPLYQSLHRLRNHGPNEFIWAEFADGSRERFDPQKHLVPYTTHRF